MPNYQNGKIYKMVCNVTGKVYIGSTTKPYLSSRIAEHKRDLKRAPKKSVNQVLENNDYYYALICNYPCNSKDELTAEERRHIENNECVNKVRRPNRSRDEELQYFREYAKTDHRKAQNKAYYEKKGKFLAKARYLRSEIKRFIENATKELEEARERLQRDIDYVNSL